MSNRTHLEHRRQQRAFSQPLRSGMMLGMDDDLPTSVKSIRFLLPDGVGADRPLSAEITSDEVGQIKSTELLSPRMLEVTRSASEFCWRFSDWTYSPPVALLNHGRVCYGTLGGVPFLQFVLLWQAADNETLSGRSMLVHAPGKRPELAMENWFREFARKLDPFVPGGVLFKEFAN